MPRPYSEDLRWRMIFQRLFYERSYAEIASQLFVCPETVRRTISTFLNTGDVKPCNIGRATGSITLGPHEEYIIMDYVLRTPQIQLHEIANHVLNATGSSFGPETLCRAVHRLGLTRKKVIVDMTKYFAKCNVLCVACVIYILFLLSYRYSE